MTNLLFSFYLIQSIGIALISDGGIYFIIMLAWGTFVITGLSAAAAGIISSLYAAKRNISFFKLWLSGILSGMIVWIAMSYYECYMKKFEMVFPVLVIIILFSISIGIFLYLFLKLKSNKHDGN